MKLWSTKKLKKRKISGRLSDVKRKLLASTHVIGEDCTCKCLKCFISVNENYQETIIADFNKLCVNEQNFYLSNLMTAFPTKQCRPRQSEENAALHDFSFSYRACVIRNNVSADIAICFKAYCSLHSISKKKLEIIQNYMKQGRQLIDRSGKHSNWPNTFSKESLDAVRLRV